MKLSAQPITPKAVLLMTWSPAIIYFEPRKHPNRLCHHQGGVFREQEVWQPVLVTVTCLEKFHHDACHFFQIQYHNMYMTWFSGLINMAMRRNIMIRGDDFKGGQTKMKAVLVDFHVGAGIKSTSTVSCYNLENIDGVNLSAYKICGSKVIYKRNVIE